MSKYTHTVIKSGQKCRPAPWWPTTDQNYINNDQRWPLMVLESGQVTKVSRDNLKAIAA